MSSRRRTNPADGENAARARGGIVVTSSGAWMDVDLPGEHRTLSWATHGGGFTTARRVSWRQVTDADLPPEVDPRRFIEADLRRRTVQSDVVLLTSRRISARERIDVDVGDVRATALATVGLSNAVRTGYVDRDSAPSIRNPQSSWGTINVLCCVDRSLSDAAMIEAVSIAAEARTLAILERGLAVDGGDATGTGTDCIVVAAPMDPLLGDPYAGKHTTIGTAIGASVHAAVSRGADRWLEERRSMAAREETS
ncbi:MAG: adenosylcobinamide amidohydrolase [Planctomycetota bacterium]